MVRFKVIKGSQLLLVVTIILLAIVIATIFISTFFNQRDVPAINQADFVTTAETYEKEAKAFSAFASFSADVQALSLDPDKAPSLLIEILPPAINISNTSKPRILIYHTHTHEAYEQSSENEYEAIEAWRTTDHTHSIVRVGEELSELLQARGFEVTHDVTDHEKEDLKTAYTRSLDTLNKYTEPFDLYIDLHRDAYSEGTDSEALSSEGIPLARLMMLIGNGVGFQGKTYYEENYAFAKALTERINTLKPNLCKDVLVKDGRYNQHIGIFSILIEVGNNKNTLNEALASLPYLADGLKSLMITAPDSQLEKIRLSSSIDE